MPDTNQQERVLTEHELMWDQNLKTEEGRAVLWWVMEQAGTFCENMFCDPHARDLCEGKRSIGLAVFKRLDPATFHQMQEEAKLRGQRDDDRRKQQPGPGEQLFD